MLNSRFYLIGTALALAVTAQSVTPAVAAESINLTAMSGYPPAAGWVRDFQKYFIPATNTLLALKGEPPIKWNEAYSGQIGKPGEELEAVASGLADVGIAVIPFETDKVPLYAISYYTPFTSNDVTLMSVMVDALAEKYPKMKDQWKPFNQVPLASAGVVDSYQVMANKPIRTAADFKGLKLGAAGPNLPWVQGLGAAGVSSNMAIVYNSIQTGVYNGVVLHAGGGKNMKLYEVAPYLVKVNFGAATAFTLTVNTNTWDKLNDNQKSALSEAAQQWAIVTGTNGSADGVLGEMIFREKGTVIEIPSEERAKWAAAMPPFALNWAADMESKGLPGKAVLTDYMATMRAAKQPVLRAWDKQ